MAKFLSSLAIFAISFIGFCTSCSNPEVKSTSFSTLDATIVSNIAYISEFDVKCSSGQLGTLYAELEGNLVPVSVIGPNKYQVSWTEDNKSARSGDRPVRIFNEEGFTTYRKALRSGDDVSTVSDLFTITVNHPGAFNGPWLQSELIATLLLLIIAYFAIACRSKVVS